MSMKLSFERAMDNRWQAAKLLAGGEAETAEQAAVAVVRRNNPRSRVQRLLAVGANTSRRRSYVCIVCGEELGHYCSAWPQTKQSKAEMAEHFEYETRVITSLSDAIKKAVRRSDEIDC